MTWRDVCGKDCSGARPPGSDLLSLVSVSRSRSGEGRSFYSPWLAGRLLSWAPLGPAFWPCKPS